MALNLIATRLNQRLNDNERSSFRALENSR